MHSSQLRGTVTLGNVYMCTALHCTVLYNTALHCTTLHCTTHVTVQCWAHLGLLDTVSGVQTFISWPGDGTFVQGKTVECGHKC